MARVSPPATSTSRATIARAALSLGMPIARCRRRWATAGPAAVFALALGWLAADPAHAQPFSLSVDSRSNLYASGHATVPITPNGGGILPPFVTLVTGTGRTLSFTTVSGSVSYNDVDAPPQFLGQYNGPDGGAVLFQDADFPNDFLTTSSPPGLLPPAAANAPTTFYMDMDSAGGISGLRLYESDPAARRVMFLAGVFTADAEPLPPAPAILDFSSAALTTSFGQLAPALHQSFYIGDGLTGTGTGATQTFAVPDAATHLYLGIIDGSYFVGGPNYYDNNRGSFSVQGVVVPEPSTLALVGGLATTAAALAVRRRVRNARRGRATGEP